MDPYCELCVGDGDALFHITKESPNGGNGCKWNLNVSSQFYGDDLNTSTLQLSVKDKKSASNKPIGSAQINLASLLNKPNSWVMLNGHIEDRGKVAGKYAMELRYDITR
jgi:hypothetical protein